MVTRMFWTVGGIQRKPRQTQTQGPTQVLLTDSNHTDAPLITSNHRIKATDVTRVAKSGSNLSHSLFNTFCCEGCENKRKQHNVFEVSFFFPSAASGACLKTEHDMMPGRAPVVEGLTALPFLITVAGRVQTGDTLARAHIALSELRASQSRWRLSPGHACVISPKTTALSSLQEYWTADVPIGSLMQRSVRMSYQPPSASPACGVTLWLFIQIKHCTTTASLVFVRALYSLRIVQSHVKRLGF